MGWFGFNGGSVLSADPAMTSFVLVTTCLAAAAGCVGAILAYSFVGSKPDLSMALNGILMALLRRTTTGEGDYVDIGMHDSLTAWMANIVSPVFVEDRNLFNVMVSRARQRMDVVTDVEPDDRTMLGRFVQWSHQPPPPAPSDTPGDGPALRLGKAFGDAGVEVRYHYPVGRHHVDVVVRVGERVLGVVCGVHPDGPDAHIDRHLALRHTGWRLVDLVPALDDAAMAAQAIEIAGDLRA